MIVKVVIMDVCVHVCVCVCVCMCVCVCACVRVCGVQSKGSWLKSQCPATKSSLSKNPNPYLLLNHTQMLTRNRKYVENNIPTILSDASYLHFETPRNSTLYLRGNEQIRDIQRPLWVRLIYFVFYYKKKQL